MDGHLCFFPSEMLRNHFDGNQEGRSPLVGTSGPLCEGLSFGTLSYSLIGLMVFTAKKHAKTLSNNK